MGQSAVGHHLLHYHLRHWRTTNVSMADEQYSGFILVLRYVMHKSTIMVYVVAYIVYLARICCYTMQN